VARPRSSHQQKTWDERQNYLDTTVRQKLTPTVDEGVENIDSTETTLAPGSEQTPSYRRTRASKPRRSWLREHWRKTLSGIVGTVIVSIAGWALPQLYSLNREVGELRVQVDGTAKQQEQLRGDLARFEDQMRQEMDRMNDRLDRFPGSR
jgi:hypothetical protein